MRRCWTVIGPQLDGAALAWLEGAMRAACAVTSCSDNVLDRLEQENSMIGYVTVGTNDLPTRRQIL